MTETSIGSRVWVIGDGYIPGWSNATKPEMLSHESASMLNTGDMDAHVTMTVYYGDRGPVGPYRITVPARRTMHQRLDHLRDPEPTPVGTGYSVLIESDQPIVVQHTGLDSRQAENAIFSTIVYPLG